MEAALDAVTAEVDCVAEGSFLASLRACVLELGMPDDPVAASTLMLAHAIVFMDQGAPGDEGIGSIHCVYMLAYACMMLSEDLHSDLARKMTVDEFIATSSGINTYGDDVPDATMRAIYADIADARILI